MIALYPKCWRGRDAWEIIAEFRIGWIMTTIVLFYFGGGLVDSVRREKP